MPHASYLPLSKGDRERGTAEKEELGERARERRGGGGARKRERDLCMIQIKTALVFDRKPKTPVVFVAFLHLFHLPQFSASSCLISYSMIDLRTTLGNRFVFP